MGFEPVPKIELQKEINGARYFARGYEATLGPIDESKESKSPRDDDDHGTHTSTAIPGSVVSGARMAPHARVAVYKMCWVSGCFGSDIIAVMEKAIDDSINVMSLSLGGGMSDYYRDTIAIRAFAAMERGTLGSCSTENLSPNVYNFSNVAPWITTVGTGTLASYLS